MMAVLQPLTPEGWALLATVTGARSVLVRGMLFYALGIARLECPHPQQIERIASAMRR